MSAAPAPARRRRPRLLTALTLAGVIAVSGCTATGPARGREAPTASTAPGADHLPAAITAVMNQPRYAQAGWSVMVRDLDTGRTRYARAPDQLAFTGSTRKLFSVGLALNTLGAEHRTTTPVYRTAAVDGAGVLHGDLDLVGAGDLTLGGRRTSTGGLAFTDFDHNDANNLGTAILTPQDPLRGVDDLARQVRATGITAVQGDVVVDDRLFGAYRVPNNDLLISPTMVNENMVDVTVTPTRPGQAATITYRPRTAALRVVGTVLTTAAGTPATVALPAVTAPSGQAVTGLVTCVDRPGCTAEVSGTIPVDYSAPLSAQHSFVGTFRIENPAAFARTAFIEALHRAGVSVTAPVVAPNPTGRVPAAYRPGDRVAGLTSPTYAEQARLVLKVSLNLGANLALTQYGLTQGQKTLSGALAAERKTLLDQHIPAAGFTFPTNGSGSPDSRATPRVIVDQLTAMSRTRLAEVFKHALPVLGVDGSLAHTGADLPAKGHVYAKTGTTVTDGRLEAQNLAGYVDTRDGHRLAFAICLNHYGPITGIDDVGQVFTDEAAIANALYGSD